MSCEGCQGGQAFDWKMSPPLQGRQRASQTHREPQPFDFSSGPVMIPPGLESSDVQCQQENKAFMMSWRWKLREVQREEPFAGGSDPPTRNFGAHQESEWADLAGIQSMHSIFNGQSGRNIVLKQWNYFDRDCSELSHLLVTPLETTGFGDKVAHLFAIIDVSSWRDLLVTCFVGCNEMSGKTK